MKCWKDWQTAWWFGRGLWVAAVLDSLHVGAYCFALLTEEETPLAWPDRQDRQENRSPGSTGSLLRGPLAVTTVGLS